MKRNTVILLLAVIIASFSLLYLAEVMTKSTIEKQEAKRKDKNILDAILAAGQNDIVNNSLRGKTVVMNVWATWCGPCRKEIPELDRMAYEFTDSSIVYIALDEEDSVFAKKMMQEKEIQFNYHLLFNQRKTIRAIQSFLLPNEHDAIPINLVINPQGKIEIFYVGYDPDKLEEMRSYLKGISAKKS